MDLLLPPELESFIQQKVQGGDFASASDVVLEGLRLLKERDEVREARLADLRREITIGIEQADQGLLIDFDERAVEELEAEVWQDQPAVGRPTAAPERGEIPRGPATESETMEDEEAARPWRGVYAAEFPEEVLFTKSIDIRPERLEEWLPQGVTSERQIRDDDD
jgi:antitoxin ParD1/3/4